MRCLGSRANLLDHRQWVAQQRELTHFGCQLGRHVRRRLPSPPELLLRREQAIAEEDLENTICQEILAEADLLADDRHCFIEASVRALDGSDRSW